MTTQFRKAPADRLDFDVDFGRYWLPDSDTLNDATATVSSEGAAEGQAVSIFAVSVSPTTVKVWVENGTDGEVATVEVVAETSGGRTKTSWFRIVVRDEC